MIEVADIVEEEAEAEVEVAIHHEAGKRTLYLCLLVDGLKYLIITVDVT